MQGWWLVSLLLVNKKFLLLMGRGARRWAEYHSTISYMILRLRQECQQHWEESELLGPLTCRSRAEITIALSLVCVSCTTSYIQLHRCLTDHHQSMSVSHCDNVQCVYSYLFQGGMAGIFGGSTLLITILYNELIFTLSLFWNTYTTSFEHKLICIILVKCHL